MALLACGGGNSPGTPLALPLLAGDGDLAAGPALTAVADTRAAASDISSGFLLRRLLVALKPDATIGQVNAAGQAVGALGITSAAPGSLLLLLEVPRQDDVAALQALAARLRAQRGIAFAAAGRVPVTSELPTPPPDLRPEQQGKNHLLGNRFPQAWNARSAGTAGCVGRTVHVYLLDVFGLVDARPNFSRQIDPSSFEFDPAGTGESTGGHGYDVAATLGGRFESVIPAGANGFSGCQVMHQIEADGLDTLAAIRKAVGQLSAGIAANRGQSVILNASVNFSLDNFCGPNSNAPCNAESAPNTPVATLRNEIEARARIAREWADLVKAWNLAPKVLIVQSAGNIDATAGGFLAQSYPGFRHAGLASAPAFATRLGLLASLLRDSALWTSNNPLLPDLTFDATSADRIVQQSGSLDPADALSPDSLLVVDSSSDGVTPDGTDPTPPAVKASAFNFAGADVRAVGENVVVGGVPHQGTSFSTPLVAGLASYLWNLSPALRAQPVAVTAALIRHSSRTSTNSPDVPLLDAYTAVQLLDTVLNCCVGDAKTPIRLGLVDANGDGNFDHLDLLLFAAAYGLGDPNRPSIPSARDYSRFDLNGDGFTGGIPIAAFDLDAGPPGADGQPVFAGVDASIEGLAVTFNEVALSDLQILCYYAYSDRYAKAAANRDEALRERTRLLGADQCVRARMSAQLPAQVSGVADLTITVEVPAGNGQFAPAANLLVQLAPTCASVSPASGRTDSSGRISTVVTPGLNCSTLSIGVTARAGSGSAVLAQASVSAVVSDDVILSGNLVDQTEIEENFPGYSGFRRDRLNAFVKVAVGSNGSVSVLEVRGTFQIDVNNSSECGGGATFRHSHSTVYTLTHGVLRGLRDGTINIDLLGTYVQNGATSPCPPDTGGPTHGDGGDEEGGTILSHLSLIRDSGRLVAMELTVISGNVLRLNRAP